MYYGVEGGIGIGGRRWKVTRNGRGGGGGCGEVEWNSRRLREECCDSITMEGGRMKTGRE